MRSVKAVIDGTWYGSLEETPAIRALLGGSATEVFNGTVSPDQSAAFPAEPGRYHLYVSYACPWAHRTILVRKLKRLENVVSMSVLHPRWAGPDGWRFGDTEHSTVDHVGGRRFLHQVYCAARPDYTGRVTVPVLWDKTSATIVNNDSSRIMRMLNSAFDAWGDPEIDFYPPRLRARIDALSAWIMRDVCTAVYRAGFARTQRAYDTAVEQLFAALDELEHLVSQSVCLCGDRPTEADWHLFVTLCRFDAVYHGALRCNLKRLIDYPALSAYARRIHDLPGVSDTVRTDHMTMHYYDAIGEIDRTIVAAGPKRDYRSTARSSTEQRPVSDACQQEILDMHEYLEHWLKGTASRGNGRPGRLAKALSDDFVVVQPNGTRRSKSDVLEAFAAAYGEKTSAYNLDVRPIRTRMISPEICLATYEERHRGEPGRGRVGTAVLRQRHAGAAIEWLFLQETPAPHVESGRSENR